MSAEQIAVALTDSEARRLVSMLRETAENFFVPDAAELARIVADQIEGQVPPPKPDEPTGLGAVVIDEHGIHWTRVETGEGWSRNPWYPAADAEVQPDEWSQIRVVRVLSSGVTP